MNDDNRDYNGPDYDLSPREAAIRLLIAIAIGLGCTLILFWAGLIGR